MGWIEATRPTKPLPTGLHRRSHHPLSGTTVDVGTTTSRATQPAGCRASHRMRFIAHGRTAEGLWPHAGYGVCVICMRPLTMTRKTARKSSKLKSRCDLSCKATWRNRRGLDGSGPFAEAGAICAARRTKAAQGPHVVPPRLLSPPVTRRLHWQAQGWEQAWRVQQAPRSAAPPSVAAHGQRRTCRP
jgi:hypothetical protein